MTIKVTKRNGEQEDFNPEKINKVIEWACENTDNVNPSDVAVNSELQITEGISTCDIHQVLIESAANLISEDSPEYSKVASRLLSYKLRKEVWGGLNPPKLLDHIDKMLRADLYDSSITDYYNNKEINKLDEKIDHNRDFIFEYAGIRQLCDKYLMQDRETGEIFETPQFVYMVIAMTLFREYKGSERMTYVRRAYNYFSKHKINLPTPIMAGVRSKDKSGASCCLIEMGDDLKSIGSTVYASALATASKYGMGVDMSNIRAIGSPIRNGETIHTGVIPFLKWLENGIKSCKQGGARRGACTVTFPIFHYEIEDILKLKDNTRTEETSARHMDYLISVSKLFWDRLIKNENITLFSSHEAREVYDSFGLPEFDELYEKYERKTSLKFKKSVPAKDLFALLFKHRIQTGRYYILNIDHANNYSPWSERIGMSNLCVEILQSVKPIYDINDDRGEIGVCVLSATNMLNIASDAEHRKICDLIVRMLDELIDYQDYFALAAKKFATGKRSLGVGVLNYAAWLAKQKLSYEDPEAVNVTSEFFEKQQYYLMEASVNLAKEKGPCNYSQKSKYMMGQLPHTHYRKEIDEFVTVKPQMDWAYLLESIEEYGLRNSTLTAIMPVEASAKISGATSGVEPPRSPITYMKSKSHTLPCILPNMKRSQDYTYAFEMTSNEGYLKCIAAIQRWTCMAISSNLYYSYNNSEDGKIPYQEVLMDHLKAYKWGLKTHYYLNTDDGDRQFEEEKGCEGGACAL